MPLDFAPYLDDWKTDPFPIYREMRDEAPVYFAKHSSSWCVFRYDDVEHVLGEHAGNAKGILACGKRSTLLGDSHTARRRCR